MIGTRPLELLGVRRYLPPITYGAAHEYLFPQEDEPSGNEVGETLVVWGSKADETLVPNVAKHIHGDITCAWGGWDGPEGYRGGWTRSHDSPHGQILCMGIPYESFLISLAA